MPECVKDSQNHERLSGKSKNDIQWIDITGKDDLLRSIGIDPKKALMELHVKDENQRILSGIDAYVLLMNKVMILKPLAKIVGLPLIRKSVFKGLSFGGSSAGCKRSGRLKE